MLNTKQISVGEGKHHVAVLASITEDGLTIQLLGGEKPHVGAVVMSIPRPSLADQETVSCNSYVLPRMSHKDDEIAKPVAERLAVTLNQSVVVVAGLHVDEALPQDIELLFNNTYLAIDKLLAELTEL
ncbi:MAG: hypothetical protein FH758_13075 [Firmicutes bacterium]|nr:hypothetical protein [Bacillota bacterium]